MNARAARAIRHWFFLIFLGIATACGAESESVVTLEHAQYAPHSGGPWAEVSLPDGWWLHDGLTSSVGYYKLSFNLESPPDPRGAVWALRTTRLSTDHRIELNGSTLATRSRGAANQALARAMPSYIDIPPGLLIRGTNVLVIEQTCAARCGLARLEVGPAQALLLSHKLHEFAWQTAPQLINAASLALAVFMVAVWWRRPREKAIGLFGLFWIPTAVRGYSYFVAYSPIPQRALEAGFFFIAMETTALFGLFALALSSKRRPWIERGFVLLALGALGIALFAGVFDLVAVFRAYVYPVLIACVALDLWILWHGLKPTPTKTLTILWLSLLVALASNIHDYLYLRGYFPLDDFYWTPWAFPVLFACFSVFLLNRMVHALDQAENYSLHLEQSVALRTAELQAANSAKTRFIASASHDLRQPLHTLGLLLGLLKRLTTQTEALAVMSRIDTAITAMDGLLHGVLDISRLDAKVEKPSVGAVALSTLLRGVEQSFGAEASHRHLRLRVKQTELWVVSDEQLLRRIVNNLVSNALRYTRTGGVLVAARRHGARVRMEVWDSGIGIASEHVDEIFLEFVQLGNPQRDRSKGLGLGLAIVQRTAKLLGHEIELKSRVGKGSLFRLTVPWVDVPGVPSVPLAQNLLVDLDGLFVVVVDDEADIRYAMQGLLTGWGCLVATASDGREAMGILKDRLREPDAILMDYRLPLETGVQVATQLHEQAGRHIPTLIVTGDTASAPLQAIATAGLPFLHKPVDPLQLRAWLAGVNASIGGPHTADEHRDRKSDSQT